MIESLVNKIENEARKSIEVGRLKYEAFFIDTNLYKEYKADVDKILIKDKYKNCIIYE